MYFAAVSLWNNSDKIKKAKDNWANKLLKFKEQRIIEVTYI